MTKVTNIIYINKGFQQYESKDRTLINFINLQRKFGQIQDYVEYHIYDLNNNLLTSNHNFKGYSNAASSQTLDSSSLIDELTVNVEKNAINAGYTYGSVRSVYNIFRNIFGSNVNNTFYVKNISNDRKELRIANNNISNIDLEIVYNNFISSFTTESYYKDFYLNFGFNNLIIGVNVLLEKTNSQYNLLIKLYEPLSQDFDLKSQFWLVDKLSDPIAYEIAFEIDETLLTEDKQHIKGPNFNISKDEVNASSTYSNYTGLFSNSATSSFQQLKSLLEEKSLEINVDYTDYPNFVHFSSAKERLLNFVYKLNLLNSYKSDLNTLEAATFTNEVSSSKSILQNNIDGIIEKFDGYEYYLYFESSSKAYPKQTSTPPYLNYSPTASQAITWLGSDNDSSILYGGQILSASLYDKGNQDNLLYSIPEYLRVDAQNEAYETFIHMIGQQFDNIWLYSKAITDLYNAESNMFKGISKDLVYHALSSLGIKLYTNSSVGDDMFSYLLGVTTSGSFLPSTGSEVINSYVTASNYSIAGSELDKEVYKRIYHNLQYLVKAKGTERGLRALISCYGIPDTILRINEFGGSDKSSGSYEQYFNKATYALNTSTGSTYVQIPWGPSFQQKLDVGNDTIVPDTIEFRFKTNGIPTSSNQYSQSLFQVNTGSSTQFGVQLLYTPLTSTGSYINYGEVRLVISGAGSYKYSDPVRLPFFDKGWWNVMLFRETGSLISSSVGLNNNYYLYAANSLYNGYDGDGIGFIGSSSIAITGSDTSSYNRSWNDYPTGALSLITYLGGGWNSGSITPNNLSSSFNGQIQEFRYWIVTGSRKDVINHTLNPNSIEIINLTSSYNKLIYRLPLGADLDVTGSNQLTSVHPTYSGSLETGSIIIGGITSSYGVITSPGITFTKIEINGSDKYYGPSSSIVYTENSFYIHLNSGNHGLTKPVNDKIRIVNVDTASGNSLSPYIRIEQRDEMPLTKDVNFLEVALSPQDSINSDIISQLGYFDIDEYVGDPRMSGSVEYPDLKTLRDFYFKKYYNSYNYFDFIRLIKYYNSSLFKMIKDFVPSRTNLSTGIVIKPHILERSKIATYKPTVTNIQYSGSDRVISSSADSGGIYGRNTSSFNEIVKTVSGTFALPHNNNEEFFTGELNGSSFTASKQTLQIKNPYWYNSSSYDDEIFKHSEYNVTLNNVSQSTKSNKRFDVDYDSSPTVAANLQNIISQSVYVYSDTQDSNYTLTRHINPRYLGSKVTSLYYNTYSTGSGSYVGDKSYGLTAAIDHNTRKLGLFTNITNSRFLPGKSEIQLKYLVDEFGNFTELNLQNKNWFELQNIFIGGGNLVIGQFDPLKNGNQRKLDGNKYTYNSGYSYSPMFYLSSSDAYISFLPEENPAFVSFRLDNISGSSLDLGSGSNLSPSWMSSSVEQNRFIPFMFSRSLDSGNYTSVSESSSKNSGSIAGNNWGIRNIEGKVSMSYYTIPYDGIYSFEMGINLGCYVYEAYSYKHLIYNSSSVNRRLNLLTISQSAYNKSGEFNLPLSTEMISSSYLLGSGSNHVTNNSLLYTLKDSESINNFVYSGSYLSPGGAMDTGSNWNIGHGFRYDGIDGGAVYAIATQSDGKILVGGAFTHYSSSISCSNIARLNPDGTLDTGSSWNIGAGFNKLGYVNSIIVQPDGQILVGGQFTFYSSSTIPCSPNQLIRLNPSGSAESSASFNVGAGFTGPFLTSASVLDMALQPDGKIIAVGDFTQVSQSTINGNIGLVRLLPNGQRETGSSWDSGSAAINGLTRAVVLQPDGKIIAAGDFTLFNGVTTNRIIRLSPSRSMDTGSTFAIGNGFSGTVYSLGLQPDGKILVGTNSVTYSGSSSNQLWRLNISGSLDTGSSWNVSGSTIGLVYDFLFEPDGKIILIGAASTFSGSTSATGYYPFRVNPSGSLATDQLNAGQGFLFIDGGRVAIQQSDRKIIIGGSFRYYSGSTTNTFVSCSGMVKIHGGYPSSSNQVAVKIFAMSLFNGVSSSIPGFSIPTGSSPSDIGTRYVISPLRLTSSLSASALFFSGSSDNNYGSSYSYTLISSESFYSKGTKIIINAIQGWGYGSNFVSTNYINFDPITHTITSSISGISSSLSQSGNAIYYPISVIDQGSYFKTLRAIPTLVLASGSGSYIQSIEGNLITFTSSFNNVLSSSFNPLTSSLYSTYGVVNDVFYPEVNDTIVVKSTYNNVIYNIENIYTSSLGLTIEVSPNFSSENTSNIQYILILKRSSDETNSIISYVKPSGSTSYGFIIPNNIHPDMLKNIDVITKETKTKLLELGN